jgi:hypothetical protein
MALVVKWQREAWKSEEVIMNIVKRNMKPVFALLAGASLLVAISATSAAADAAAEEEVRTTVTRHFQGDGRENAVAIKETRDEHTDGAATGTRSSKSTAGATPNKSSLMASAANADFWFYLADIELYADDDRDGYFSGIDLLIDVDTYFSVADIYAVAYLSYEGGPWEEYAVTEDFTIFGSSGTDDYVIVTDLVSGYPRGDYDLLIEVFDARNDAFLAFIGPDESSELALLPLEDMSRDAPPSTETRVTVNNGGGGSLGLLSLFVLALAVFAGRVRTRSGIH